MYYGDYGLAKDRAQQIRAEIQHNRLEAALASGNSVEKTSYASKSPAARVSTIIAALIR